MILSALQRGRARRKLRQVAGEVFFAHCLCCILSPDSRAYRNAPFINFKPWGLCQSHVWAGFLWAMYTDSLDLISCSSGQHPRFSALCRPLEHLCLTSRPALPFLFSLFVSHNLLIPRPLSHRRVGMGARTFTFFGKLHPPISVIRDAGTFPQ